jgi:hypothetical protein
MQPLPEHSQPPPPSSSKLTSSNQSPLLFTETDAEKKCRKGFYANGKEFPAALSAVAVASPPSQMFKQVEQTPRVPRSIHPEGVTEAGVSIPQAELMAYIAPRRQLCAGELHEQTSIKQIVEIISSFCVFHREGFSKEKEEETRIMVHAHGYSARAVLEVSRSFLSFFFFFSFLL